MRREHIFAASFAFLMVIVAVYFGASIHNAYTNQHITYLNEMDNIQYFNVDVIPELNARAAAYTLPFIIFIILLEAYIIWKTKVRVARNIAIGLLVAVLIISSLDMLTLTDPTSYDFSKWGYVWITLGLFLIAGNVISAFLKPGKDVK